MPTRSAAEVGHVYPRIMPTASVDMAPMLWVNAFAPSPTRARKAAKAGRRADRQPLRAWNSRRRGRQRRTAPHVAARSRTLRAPRATHRAASTRVPFRNVPLVDSRSITYGLTTRRGPPAAPAAAPNSASPSTPSADASGTCGVGGGDKKGERAGAGSVGRATTASVRRPPSHIHPATTTKTRTPRS